MLIFEEESVGSVRLMRRSRSDTEDEYIAQGYLIFYHRYKWDMLYSVR